MLGPDRWKRKIHSYSRLNTLFWVNISKIVAQFCKKEEFWLGMCACCCYHYLLFLFLQLIRSTQPATEGGSGGA